jgi:DNA mismatch repair protein MutL
MSPATIHVLPPAIRSQIAAGEIVQRPASVVKELIENAIDADARAISIEVRDGGLGLIRVADDGIGMSRIDAPQSIARFSTSKIESMQDLEAIRTLGFRGEALSSIAAVAQLEILTRTAQEIEGTRIQATAGAAEIISAASPVGTSVTVRNLFVDFPARRRFLKSRMREGELVQQIVRIYALAYPQIAFRLTIDGKVRILAPPAKLLARISAILGHEIAEEMVPVAWNALDLSVEGFVSRPTLGRTRRDGQYFAVNDRPIRAGLLAVMLERPYAGRLPQGRRPLAVLHIHIAHHLIDVNVHPSKAEVRFSQERSVYNAVAQAVGTALQDYPRTESQIELSWPFSFPSSVQAIGEENVPYTTPPGQLRALAQLHNTYILAQTWDGLAIADQHAAHEQVLFEWLGRESKNISLSPAPRLELTRREMDTLERIASLLDELGIEIEPFGSQTFLIRTLPASLPAQDAVDLVTTLLQEGSQIRGNENEQRERLAMKAACTSAIKAGDPLTMEQAQRLLDDLANTWSPGTCPHGRPAIVLISMEELARRFGR